MTAQSITTWLESLKVSTEFAALGGWSIATLCLLIISLLVNLLAKSFINYLIHPLIKKTSIEWDDLLIKNRVIVRFSHIIPAISIKVLAPIFLGRETETIRIVDLALNLYVIVIILFVIDGALNFMRDVWERGPLGRRFPAKSFTQAIKLVVNMI